MDPNVIDLQRWRDFNDAPAQPEDEPFMHLDPEPAQTAIFFDVVFGYLEGFIPLRGFIDKGQGTEGKPHNAWIPADADAAFNAAAFARWAALRRQRPNGADAPSLAVLDDQAAGRCCTDIAACSTKRPLDNQPALVQLPRREIATGLVVGDLIGEGAAREQAVVGERPNIAARLQVSAGPGGVVTVFLASDAALP
jgi:class 3 adenylate cyclase